MELIEALTILIDIPSTLNAVLVMSFMKSLFSFMNRTGKKVKGHIYNKAFIIIVIIHYFSMLTFTPEPSVEK